MPPPRVLCVDDEEVGLRVRQLMLQSENYDVTTAINGPIALELFEQQPFDLVILDYSMPSMNGGEVAARMKKLRPSVPIIMLSAYVTIPDGDRDHVDISVTKGNSTAHLLATVKKVLERGSVFREARGAASPGDSAP